MDFARRGIHHPEVALAIDDLSHQALTTQVFMSRFGNGRRFCIFERTRYEIEHGVRAAIDEGPSSANVSVFEALDEVPPAELRPAVGEDEARGALAVRARDQ